MSRLKKVMKGRKGTFLLLGAAVLLLAGSAVGSARAALTYYSENYTAQMEMYDIGVTLVEESAISAAVIMQEVMMPGSKIREHFLQICWMRPMESW